jgi:hypothetical protein
MTRAERNRLAFPALAFALSFLLRDPRPAKDGITG